MKTGDRIVGASVRRPKTVTALMVLVTLALALLAALPSVWPKPFLMLNGVKVDTDPENMLPADEPTRVFHDEMKREMSLHDMVVVGVVNEKHPEGVFNPESLRKIYDLTEFAKGLRWDDPEDPDKKIGVIEADLIAPSTVDNIEQSGVGAITFEWLMSRPPETQEEAEAVRDKALRIPFLKDTVVSGDGKAIALYLPLTSKDLSYRVYSALSAEIATYKGDEEFYITGLPVAEDTFGVEMFKQMAISAPIAMVIIFLLMLLFFRKLVLVVSPMIVAVVSVICTMGLLIATGRTVHIMSSMIPIFIMPIAVLDAVHILSEFFDRYPAIKDRRKTITDVMHTLFVPMLYTSLTTAAGFASLALTPIPPVQVFGLFIAFGVMVAWLLTITFIPAFVMFIPDRRLEGFGHAHVEGEEDKTFLGRMLAATGRRTYRRAKPILGVVLLLLVISGVGISRIKINDNPIKWFAKSHPIRVADVKLNAHFGGTYMAFLALEAPEEDFAKTEEPSKKLASKMQRTFAQMEDFAFSQKALDDLAAQGHELARSAKTREEFYAGLGKFAAEQLAKAPDDQYDTWDELTIFIDRERQSNEIFKDPDALRYIEDLQVALKDTGVVGKSNSLPDIVKTVHRELLSGEETDFRIPDSPRGVAQCLIQYQNSHRPQDLWHFVTKDYRKSVLWVQLTSGDNRDMSRVVAEANQFFRENPPPDGLTPKWFGLTYINVIWQDKMVSGMLQAFLGSFLVVLLMMIVLFRSALWGLLCMIPLTATIAGIYGVIGWVGKDYDMPVAVLSSLALGLAVDYAIHFLSRTRQLHAAHGAWADTAGPVFGEPARAIARNVIVIGIGFLPLLAAPLVPYKTVGMLIAAILVAAGVATLFILPCLITLLERWLFPATKTRVVTCLCGTCLLTVLTVVALVAVNAHQFLGVRAARLTWYSLGAVIVLFGICAFTSRRESCRASRDKDEEKGDKQ